MTNFFKFVFASCLGVFLAGIVMFSLSFLVLGRMASSLDSPKKVNANTVLTLDFSAPIPEKTNNLPVDPYSFETESIIGLHDIAAAIKHAKSNDNIKGVFLDLGNVSTGRASAKVIREALEDFKSDGKFVISNAKYYTQGSYYLASVADKIYVNPLGSVDFRGFSSQVPFFKDMLDRLGIKMQVYYAGQFKSATEPFRRYDMSPQNKTQVRAYLEEMYGLYLDEIAQSRDISTTELRDIANGYKVRDADDAIQYKLVDDKLYRDQILDDIRTRLGIEKDAKIKSISVEEYGKGNKFKKDFSVKDKIAVVFAEGSVVDGVGEEGNIGGDKYAKIIRKLRNNDKIKAIVVRVNSGGGSGLASDIMWRELQLAKEQGIPIVASMGDLAASGGYYIACNADSIFAEPNTITGSIGVFGMIPSLQNMLKDKVGVTFDSVKTGPYAIGLNPFFDINDKEGKIIQNGVEEFYEIFLKRVADGRSMSREEVHEVAQGRVWTGAKAKELGLVDKLGGLDEAIASAASLAGLEKYRISEYPVVKEPIEKLVDQFTGKKKTSYVIQNELGDLYPYYEHIKCLKEMKGVQARLPFIIESY